MHDKTTCIGMHRNWGCCETGSLFVSSRWKFDGTWLYGSHESHHKDMRENLPHAHLQSQGQISFHSNNDWACQISMHKLASVAIPLSLQALSHHSNQSNYSTAPIKTSKPWHMMNCRKHLKLLAFKTWISVANYNMLLQICCGFANVNWVVLYKGKKLERKSCFDYTCDCVSLSVAIHLHLGQ
jgi:hypothetical protein